MTINDFLLFVAFLVAWFLFEGDPDIWDMMHKAVMNYLKEQA